MQVEEGIATIVTTGDFAAGGMQMLAGATDIASGVGSVALVVGTIALGIATGGSSLAIQTGSAKAGAVTNNRSYPDD